MRCCLCTKQLHELESAETFVRLKRTWNFQHVHNRPIGAEKRFLESAEASVRLKRTWRFQHVHARPTSAGALPEIGGNFCPPEAYLASSARPCDVVSGIGGNFCPPEAHLAFPARPCEADLALKRPVESAETFVRLKRT